MELLGGYFLFKDFENQNLWIVFVIIIVILCIGLLGGINGLKAIMHRPRYRLISTSEVPFHNWWQPCKDYKTWIEQLGTNSDNFKSFPSGHTAEAAIMMAPVTFLPLANRKYRNIQKYLYIGAFALILIVAFARILAAAHYLSDVSTGATIMLLLVVITNEVVMKIKLLQLSEVEQ